MDIKVILWIQTTYSFCPKHFIPLNHLILNWSSNKNHIQVILKMEKCFFKIWKLIIQIDLKLRYIKIDKMAITPPPPQKQTQTHK